MPFSLFFCYKTGNATRTKTQNRKVSIEQKRHKMDSYACCINKIKKEKSGFTHVKKYIPFYLRKSSYPRYNFPKFKKTLLQLYCFFTYFGISIAISLFKNVSHFWVCCKRKRYIIDKFPSPSVAYKTNRKPIDNEKI